MGAFSNLFSRIMGFVIIVLTLAMAPSINTANATVASGNLTNLIGMDALTDFGAPLIILGLLSIGGLFAISSRLKSASMADVMKVVGAVVVAIIGLSFMEYICDYCNELIAASEGFAIVIYGIIPLAVYIFIIASSGWATVRAFRTGGRRRSKAYV